MALLALALAALGIFGVVEFGVAQSRKEIGLRIALGARVQDVMLGAVRPAGIVVGAGMFAGLVASWLLASGLNTILFGVSAHDPLTLVMGLAGLFVVALAAATLPARRASMIDPATTLRAD